MEKDITLSESEDDSENQKLENDQILVLILKLLVHLTLI